MTNFIQMGLPEPLLKMLAKIEYTTPTPIQQKAIPVALKGRDILGSAQTGTGKTAAFAIPLITHVLKFPDSRALIVTPTRELAQQVATVVHQMLCFKSGIQTALLIGGDSMSKQLDNLKRKPQILVGTPGRINDHLKRKSLFLDKADFLVLDEADRMLDMGFGVQIDAILKFMPRKRQSLLFSATISDEIEKLSSKYLTNPDVIEIEKEKPRLDNIHHEIFHMDEKKKSDFLFSELDQRDGAVVVFIKTKRAADRLVKKLTDKGFEAEAIHSDLRQSKRERVIKAFRAKKFRVLVATDVAARGLDVPHIRHVINYNLPQCPEDYIHRIGRTGRAGATGAALCMLSPDEGRKWHAIAKLFFPESLKDISKKDKPKSAHGTGKNPKSKKKRAVKNRFKFKKHDRKGKVRQAA